MLSIRYGGLGDAHRKSEAPEVQQDVSESVSKTLGHARPPYDNRGRVIGMMASKPTVSGRSTGAFRGARNCKGSCVDRHP